MRLVAISDTHNLHEKLGRLPDGDLLIHCGDFTTHGKEAEARTFVEWFASRPHKHKVLIAGNHDYCVAVDDRIPAFIRSKGINYLMDSEVTLEGVRIYGSPWSIKYGPFQFMLPTGPELAAKWDLIPAGIDVLVTHGPPKGFGDLVDRGAINVGCPDLLKKVLEIKPELHIFGHIHEGYGSWLHGKTHFVNASSHLGLWKGHKTPPMVFDI
jgi:Icc-related predicted phosphoesterase